MVIEVTQDRHSAAAMVAALGSMPGSAVCYGCDHSIHAHYTSGDAGGCLGAPVIPGSPVIAGCGCQGWVQGMLPWEWTRYLDPVSDDDEQRCGGCGHGLAQHGGGYGCWCCPCERD